MIVFQLGVSSLQISAIFIPKAILEKEEPFIKFKNLACSRKINLQKKMLKLVQLGSYLHVFSGQIQKKPGCDLVYCIQFLGTNYMKRAMNTVRIMDQFFKILDVEYNLEDETVTVGYHDQEVLSSTPLNYLNYFHACSCEIKEEQDISVGWEEKISTFQE